MSKKNIDIIESNRSEFVNTIINKGYSSTIANNIFDKIVKFAGYGFNKSHSVAYCHFAYKQAYLKANYPSYFMKNLLNNSKNSDHLKEYIDEAKYLGINFEPIDINKSSYDFESYDNSLVMPFSLIKSISINVCNYIVEERKKGEFKDFYDFMIRCYNQIINKKIVVSLLECGAFNKFNINNKAYVNNIDEIINYVSLCKNLSLVIDEKPAFDEKIKDYSDSEIIDNEINNYGFYLSFHPVTKYDRTTSIKLNEIYNYFNKTVTCILYVENVKTIKTKNNDKMSFITLSDEYLTIEGVLFPDTYRKIGDIKKNKVYKVICNVEKRNNNYQLIIYNVIQL